MAIEILYWSIFINKYINKTENRNTLIVFWIVLATPQNKSKTRYKINNERQYVYLQNWNIFAKQMWNIEYALIFGGRKYENHFSFVYFSLRKMYYLSFIFFSKNKTKNAFFAYEAICDALLLFCFFLLK